MGGTRAQMWGSLCNSSNRSWEGLEKPREEDTWGEGCMGGLGAMECKCAFFPMGLQPARSRLHWKYDVGVKMETLLLS